MRMPICHCSRCHSANTICVKAELLREHWYCYDCGRGFEVPRLHATSTVSSRLTGRSNGGTRSLGAK
jgi:hypothetical protein